MFEELRLRNNPGVLTGKLPDELLAVLKKNIKASTEDRSEYNLRLIGHIEEQYQLKINYQVSHFIEGMAAAYQQMFQYELNMKPKIVDLWVNLQKKHEYNPVHHHFNKLGWVIWVQIPYDLQEELNAPNNVKTVDRKKRNSAFEFIYPKITGELQTHPIFLSKEDEGKIVMFPKGLKHTVYPFFTSDGYRISVAGNLDFV
ncbi:Conserved hypothetical protein CHP02466 [uncultured Caudovirales phage]|jgi:hypothetical protein|uniref:2OG-Fe(II) oxygenase n=1 Tax=uncultured Caudovirales phage TaxID=2100421 RepID=A0A6J5M1S2_9CAUD|nr:Conserved hypothetical protein CHP02466 [uncultured Caudovirales phage]